MGMVRPSLLGGLLIMLCSLSLKLCHKEGACHAAEEGFSDLFNGRDLDGWEVESHTESEFHADGRPVWRVEDGEIVCDGRGFGFLRYAREPFGDATLRIDFQLGRTADGSPCNSGIGLRSGIFQSSRSRTTRPSIRGYELQLLDDSGQPPSPRSTGSLYRYVAPLENPIRPTGEWNSLEVAMLGTRLRVVLNGQLIQDVDQETISQIRTKPLSGFVALQNHGGPVRFRAIRIRREQLPIPGASALEAQWAILRSRDPLIGIRGVLRFALEATCRGWNADAVDEALEVARGMQVVDRSSPDFGNFRWRLGDTEVHDANAREFAGQLLALLRLEDDGRLVPRPGGRRLSPHSRQVLETMARDTLESIRGHSIQPGYTNIALMQIWNLLALGDLVGPEVVAEGEGAWREWRSFTASHGWTEYLCPTYMGVSLDSLALIADHAPVHPAGAGESGGESGGESSVRIEAEAMLGYAWQSIACHWFGPAGRLSGPHARDYDYPLGRGYLDEHLVDAGWLTLPPRAEGAGWLPGAPRSPLHGFRTACRREPPGSLSEEIVAAVGRSVVERTGQHPWQRITNYVGQTVTIGVAGEGRGAEDKTLLINLPPEADRPSGVPSEPWRTPNVTLVFDGRRDPYGVDRVPAGLAGHLKSHHLRPYMLSSQDGPRVTAMWFLDPRRPPFGVDPGALACLEAHLLLPAGCTIWSGDKPVDAGATLPADAVVFLRGHDAAVGLRYLAPSDADLAATGLRLVADGGRHAVQRLTATFADGPPQRGALLALDIEAREACDDTAFAAFRREFASREVTLLRAGTTCTVSGSLPLELDLGVGAARPRRLIYEPVLAAGELMLLNRVEIGRAALEIDDAR